MNYCTKEGSYISNLDVANILAKTATKKKIGRRLLDGATLEECMQEDPGLFYDYKKMKANIREREFDLYEPTMREIKGEWLYGAPRLGKSWLAMKKWGLDPKKDLKKVCIKFSNNKWWDTYNKHKYVLVDELDKA